MAFLELKNLGKIYASDNSIAVGIRGVSLDFELGEFVAVTGKSGSGKTTLLNCISGMDTYEEGELYINGESTSHYTQTDWEEYRQKYISFVFQDYNIIDSFTVLQNVEFALTHIESKSERRRRALELIDRVGMTSHKHSKGSKLSGGQKQRTVIARALAKDSPIILADEPTGNLDSKTSEEIVALLAEISREKLVIVVTHSFSQFESVATREVRIYDGGVERDCRMSGHETVQYVEKPVISKKKRDIRLGLEFGKHKFLASPKLSIFMCAIMIVAMLGCFISTSMYFAAVDLSTTTELFTYSKGRLVVSRQDGAAMSDGELSDLQKKLGADRYIHYDHLFEYSQYVYADIGLNSGLFLGTNVKFELYKGESLDVGRAPENRDECALVLPIGWKQMYGDSLTDNRTIELFSGCLSFKITGIKYYYDNTRPYSHVLLSEDGFDMATDMAALTSDTKNINVGLRIRQNREDFYRSFGSIGIDSSLGEKEYYVVDYNYKELTVPGVKNSEVEFTYMQFKEHNINLASDGYIFRADKCSDKVDTEYAVYGSGIFFVSPELAATLADKFYHDEYTQASLFFNNDRDAKNAKDELSELGYVGIVSNEKYDSGIEAVLQFIMSIMKIFMWFLSILFLSFFVSLCSTRALAASNGDFAIMRSMGINNRIVKISMYVRMLISIIPAIISLGILAPVLYLNPKTNEMFPFLHVQHYVIIIVGLVLLSILTTHRCNKRIFKASVIGALKGGDKA